MIGIFAKNAPDGDHGRLRLCDAHLMLGSRSARVGRMSEAACGTVVTPHGGFRLNKAERRDAGVKLIALSREATRAAENILADATAAMRPRVMVENQIVEGLFDREQRATHGLAWLATYVESIRQLAAYAERIHAAGTLGAIEEMLIQIGMGEYLSQIQGGIPMSASEIVRPADVELAFPAIAERLAGPVETLMSGNAARRARLIELMRRHE